MERSGHTGTARSRIRLIPSGRKCSKVNCRFRWTLLLWFFSPTVREQQPAPAISSRRELFVKRESATRHLRFDIGLRIGTREATRSCFEL
jgi:hypothetical protein